MKIIKNLLAAATGMTLIELIAALALVSIVASGLISVYWYGASAFKREGLQADAQYDARAALDRISIDVAECSDLEVRDKNGIPLSVNIPATEEQNPVSLHLDGVDVTYRTGREGRLQRCQSGDTKTITVYKADTDFINRGKGTVEICLEVLDENMQPVFQVSGMCGKKVF
jgi:prepilin-type N-terminal cleavage/methylation domain-containing protein